MLKFNSTDQDIWFISDTHYWHKNITYGESVWPEKEKNCRRFDTTQEMSRHIVKQINTYVKEDDILFFLGDWCFGGIANIWNFRKQLRCKTIHFVHGNHDHHIINKKSLPNCMYSKNSFDLIGEGIDAYPYIVDGQTDDFFRTVFAEDLFKSDQKYLEVQIDGVLVVMFHYPIEEWNDRHKSSYHLFGHVHGRIPHGNGRLDVGIDNAYKLFKEYRPFHWKDIRKLLGNPKQKGGAVQ